MNSTIKVYKTDVTDKREATEIVKLLIHKFPSSDVSFDLEDCDNVLRIEAPARIFDEEIIRHIFKKKKHSLEVLPF